MFVNSSSTTGNQWEFRPGTCETWAYLESIVHYWQTWKSITVLAPSMNGRLLSDFFPFCSTKCLGNFAVAVSNDLFFQIFKQSSWKQNKWCTLDTFFDSKKNWEKTEKCNEKCIFSWHHPELYRRKVAPAFSSTLHASSSADIPWPTNWPWKIQGLGMGWPERPWVGLAAKKNGQQKHVPRNQLLETNILVTHAAIQ